jgi:hypothetical protein
MGDVIERTIRAGDLPAELRGTLDADALARVTVRAVTESRFTRAFEDSVRQSALEAEGIPFRPAAEVIAELRRIAGDEP